MSLLSKAGFGPFSRNRIENTMKALGYESSSPYKDWSQVTRVKFMSKNSRSKRKGHSEHYFVFVNDKLIFNIPEISSSSILPDYLLPLGFEIKTFEDIELVERYWNAPTNKKQKFKKQIINKIQNGRS